MSSPYEQGDKSLKDYSYLILAIIIIFSAVAFMVYIITVRGDSTDATPTPSCQEQNLAVLKTVKPNDLMLCVDGNKNPSQPYILSAILVDQNDGGFLHGYNLNSRQLTYIQHGGYPYGRFSNCEVRIVKEPFARETIGQIILHGLSPPPPK